ncbi:MAG: hypothetical protein QOG15_3157 [Solirubrobacteraceae bacterium]|jgi:hypothetical protein|nr:hypothetical protein [Solirubrobacteraceae bacterium]
MPERSAALAVVLIRYAAPPMGLVLVTTFGLVCWIVLWAIGAKALDGFLVTTLVIMIGAAGRMLLPYLPGRE